MSDEEKYVTVLELPGVVFKPTAKAPLDYVEINPLLFGEMLKCCGPDVAIFTTSEQPKFYSDNPETMAIAEEIRALPK